MKPRLCLMLSIACLLLFMSLCVLGFEHVQGAVATAPGERDVANAAHTPSPFLSQAQTLTATYDFDLD
ncbi:MAG: hypothetical protein PVI80_07140, partial [Anaerolineae bacterium]